MVRMILIYGHDCACNVQLYCYRHTLQSDSTLEAHLMHAPNPQCLLSLVQLVSNSCEDLIGSWLELQQSQIAGQLLSNQGEAYPIPTDLPLDGG